MVKRICVLTALLMFSCCMCLFGSTAFAAEPTEFNYFGYETKEIDGEDVLVVELGLNRPNTSYRTANKLYLPQQLVLRFAGTVPGRLRHETKLSGDLGKRVMVQETELEQTQVSIEMNFALSDDCYKIYTLEADKANKKPFRVVIEIKKPAVKGAPGLKNLQGHKIVLDAGHGGSDSGAVGPHRVKEKDICLAVTKKVRDILTNSGATVAMTRETDRDVYGVNAEDRQELQARVDVGRRMRGAEVFVSIHCNAFSSPEANGMETYHYAGSTQGRRLATLLNQELETAGGLFNRGVKTANFYVLRHSPMPASLVELAFITNYREEKLLSDPAYQDKLAEAIAIALSRYF